ncbi:hypothetical protein ACI3QN_07315, partial [Propionibacterium freudenreichii]
SVVTHILPGGLRYLTRSQPPGEVQLAGWLAARGGAGSPGAGWSWRRGTSNHEREALSGPIH